MTTKLRGPGDSACLLVFPTFYSTIVLLFFLLGFKPYGSPQFTGISIEKDPPRNCIFNCSSASLTPGGLHDPIATWTYETFRARHGSKSTRLVCREMAFWERLGYHKKSIYNPKNPEPLKNDYFEDPDPCYTGSNPSIGGSKDS